MSQPEPKPIVHSAELTPASQQPAFNDEGVHPSFATTRVNKNRGKVLPFSNWYPVVFGALLGVVLRAGVFIGKPGEAFAPMMGSFIFGVPIFVGAATVFIAELKVRQSWSFYFWGACAANALFVLGTLLIMIEGMICAIVIVPMFALLGGVAGLVMGAICRWTNLRKHTLALLAVLPAMMGALEHRIDTPVRYDTVSQTIFIQASPAKVWDLVIHAKAIQPSEISRAWIYRIGAPLIVEGHTDLSTQPAIRTMRWDKDIEFSGLVTRWEAERELSWDYQFKPDTFPKGTLDDHVVIGGQYFDLKSSSYTLKPVTGGTELTLTVRYRISTTFNTYASWAAEFLLNDFSEVILQFYKQRSESGRQA